MTLRELVNALSAFPQDLPVRLDCAEGVSYDVWRVVNWAEPEYAAPGAPLQSVALIQATDCTPPWGDPLAGGE